MLVPRYCSQNWTCEVGKRTTVQCNAQAHKITDMFIYAVDCRSLSECYATKMNSSFVDDLIYQLELGTEAVKAAADDGGVGGDDFEPKPKKKKISLSDYDDAEPDDPPESVQHDTVVMERSSVRGSDDAHLRHQHQQQQQQQQHQSVSPLGYDQLESLDNGLTWSIKTKFRVRGFHLVVCIARNEIGDSVVTKLILVGELF